MKLLLALSVLQAAALAVLTGRLLSDDRSHDPSAIAEAALEAALSASSAAGDGASGPLLVKADAPTIDEIRRAVREEIAAFSSRQAAAPQAAAAPFEQLVDPVAAARAQRELDLYISRGRIGPREMQSLEANWAELPPAEQMRLRSKLARAANEGRLDIQF